MHQLSLTLTPREVGAAAAAACVEKAERGGFDTAGAAAFILDWLTQNGPTSGEDLTDAAIAQGFRPHDSRAFGPVYAGLVRRQRIKCVGTCERRRGHGTAGGRIWGLA